MKNYRVLSTPLSALLIGMVGLAACSSLPEGNPALNQARSDYRNAEADPKVARYAPAELQLAGRSLETANATFAKDHDSKDIDHLAFVAKQQVGIARETAGQRAAEAAVGTANAERDQVRLAERTREADRAALNAADAQRQAEASQRQSEASQRSADAALQQAAAGRLAAANAQAGESQARQAAADADSRAKALEASLADLSAKKTDRGMVITLGDVLFDTNHAELKSGGIRNVQKLADFFKRYPRRNVLIEGFTDSTGSNSRNQELSDQRTYAVRSVLIDSGMGAERITTRGYAEAYPVAGNDSVGGRQLNRRVEVIVSDDSGVIAPR